MTKAIAKIWNGRKIKEEKTIIRGPNVEFGALYEAEDYLASLDIIIKTGWLDGNNPIGLAKEYIPSKWHNLSQADKDKLDGVLVSEDFKLSNVKIIFFE